MKIYTLLSVFENAPGCQKSVVGMKALFDVIKLSMDSIGTDVCALFGGWAEVCQARGGHCVGKSHGQRCFWRKSGRPRVFYVTLLFLYARSLVFMYYSYIQLRPGVPCTQIFDKYW